MRQAVGVGRQMPVLVDVSFAIILCRRLDTPIAAGNTRYGTDEMDFDPVCVDDCRTVVCRAQDRAGEGTGYPRQLGDHRCARSYLLVRMGGVHSACDWSSQTVPVDGAKVCTPYSDPPHRVAHDGSPGSCHRILSEPRTCAIRFSHNGSRRAAPSTAVRSQCSIYELYWRAYLLVIYGFVSVDPLLPCRYGAPDDCGATGDAALPCRTGEP